MEPTRTARRAGGVVLLLVALIPCARAQDQDRFQQPFAITVPAPVNAIAFSAADPGWLAYATSREVIVVDLASRAPRWGIPLADARGLAFVGPDSNLWVATADGRLRLYDAEGRPRSDRELRFHRRQLQNFAADRDGRRLVTSASSGWVRVSDLDGSGNVGRDSYHREVDRDHNVKLALTPDGRRLVLASPTSENLSYQFRLQLWDLTTDEKITVRSEPFWNADGVAICPDGRFVAFWEARRLRLFRRGEDPPWSRVSDHHPETQEIGAIAFSPDAQYLAAACSRRLLLYDTADGAPKPGLEGGPAEVTAMAFREDGRFLAVAGRMGGVTLWRIEPPLAPEAIPP